MATVLQVHSTAAHFKGSRMIGEFYPTTEDDLDFGEVSGTEKA